jgi:methylenetetrahydrofolate reductase (NADPH)
MQWGRPQEMKDVQDVFVAYLSAKIPSTPFSSDPLSAESAPIIQYLLRLTENGCWTVASQPAVDAAPSQDAVIGWGPPSGYVFQKPFVEFFCHRDQLDQILEKIDRQERGVVSYFAADNHVCPVQ